MSYIDMAEAAEFQVGGKLELGEDSASAAYRELQEETGISRRDIRLYRLMDITYYHLNFVLEIWFGILENDVTLREELNPLQWLSLEENFTDKDRFAGEQNIAHIINVALQYPLPEYKLKADGRYIGADGCKNGWIAAVIEENTLSVKRFDSVYELVKTYPTFDGFLIDMAIGLQESMDDIRPDDILDAVCLAVVAGLKAQEKCEIIPENPQKDAKGLLMQMVVPKAQ